MTDWRREQIGLGVTRCPDDPEPTPPKRESNITINLSEDGWAALNPEPARASPILGELARKPRKHWFRR